MKSKQSILAAGLVALFGLMTITLPSCSDTKAENASQATPAMKAVPRLKERQESLGTTDERVDIALRYDQAHARVKANANDADGWLALAEIFINEARVTGEHPYYYPAALDMISNALSAQGITPDQRFVSLSMRGMVEMSLHQFAAALKTGEEAVALNPHNSGAYGVLVDANVELGNYAKAVEWSDKMVATRPDLRSYSRISYLREIHGDVSGAIEAMEMAVEAGYPGLEQTSWCRITLGKLHETYGNLDHAQMHYQIALDQRPNYPFAIAALAGVEMKKKNYEAAEEMLAQAMKMIPEVSFAEQQAELYALTGRQDLADQKAEEVLAMLQDDADHGHKVDLGFAQAQLHLMHNPAKALEYALREQQARPSNIEVNTLLAEIYLQLGDLEKAGAAVEMAKKTQSKNPELLGIGGVIEMRKGNAEEGKAMILESMQADPFQTYAITEEMKKNI
jgi:tetratricopeptide (TPR) repeat protein